MLQILSDNINHYGLFLLVLVDNTKQPSHTLIFFQVIWQHFVSAISETIGEKWTAELETAYNHLFAILSFDMKEALLVEQQKNTL